MASVIYWADVQLPYKINKCSVCGLWIRIQIQDLRLIRIRIQFWILIKGFLTQICKMLQLKKNHFFIKKDYFFIPRPPWRKSKLQEKPPVLNKKTSSISKHEMSSLFYFCRSFLPSWIWIQPTKMNADPWRSGSKYTIMQKCITKPDPQL